ncbi:hypothetical protein LCGC14_0963410 [marine sediment metagenome]|uniref:Uncharacterized protein n=1 Tax=marine sediment metagenome TaxID=412755 RepID=A0A0F9NZV7_9ZZZZ
MQPHRLKIGSSVILVSVDGLAVDWGIPEEGIVKLLSIFAIPVLTLPGGDKRYVSLWSLELALFEAGLPVACRGTQAEVRAIHAAAGIVYGTLTKEVIRERLSRLQQDLARTGPHTSARRKKPGSGKKTRSR